MSPASSPTPIEQLLTVADVQKLLRVSRSFVYEAARSGQLEGVRLGRHLRFESAAVQRFIEKSRTNAPRAMVLPIARAR